MRGSIESIYQDYCKTSHPCKIHVNSSYHTYAFLLKTLRRLKFLLPQKKKPENRLYVPHKPTIF